MVLSQSRLILAFDDGFFPPSYKGRRGKTIILGVKTLDIERIKAIGYRYVYVDGRETTETIIGLTRILSPADLILLDGITYAGFDVADPLEIYSKTGIQTVVIQQYPLNLDRIRRALMKHFEDYNERYRVISSVYSKLKYLETPWKTIQYYAYPEDKQVSKLLRQSMIYSPIPEPLRIAHLLASTYTRYLFSKGYL